MTTTTQLRPSISHAPAARSLGAQDLHYFREGTHAHLHELFGCHVRDGAATFRVWAPNAAQVSVVGDWNGWTSGADLLRPLPDDSGIWEGSVAGVRNGHAYKYRIVARDGRSTFDKADPFAFYAEVAPGTASRAWILDYDWGDARWMSTRHARNALDAPMSIYELHLGSWRRPSNALPRYRDIAQPLADYVSAHGFTHVELMPITEHPFYGSWGYQTTGYFAATSRYGEPQDFMYLVDVLHQRGIGVILDWVPSHFPDDPHGLARFDGTHLYEHADPRQGYHPEWNSLIFNYDRHEVRSFLISSALFWLDRYHIDGLRVDAVASMLYLDYARKAGDWVPNRHGGKENLGAIAFLQDLNVAVYREHSDVQVIAEESTSWPMVSRPVDGGGLGFGLKWNMGWMHDTLAYFRRDPVHRRHAHGQLTFSIWYAFAENFVLALSHDEVVYGKGSLLAKMPGDDWLKFANLRLLFGYKWAHPGKKLVFMGGEFGQRHEWTHEGELDWSAAAHPAHAGVARWVGDLNALLHDEPALHEIDFEPHGFQWIDCNDDQASVLAFLRRSRDGRAIVVVCNFTPVPRMNRVVGVPFGGRWREALNSDAAVYGGSGIGNLGGVVAAPVPAHGHYHSLSLTLPPLSALFLVPDARP
ncbi:MAG TPA: 1,4-alpha-glucan branching protein GlgB [Casimicrobiaceae bacterium]|nr:1,4-alpha-glucan branching protein GlgB [Casimicrobiaceae bacterium]